MIMFPATLAQSQKLVYISRNVFIEKERKAKIQYEIRQDS